MKISSPCTAILAVSLALCLTGISCGDSGSSGSSDSVDSPDSAKKSLSVSNVLFDSVSRELSAGVTADDGVTVTISGNNASESAVALDNEISLTFVKPLLEGITGGKSYSFTVSAAGYQDSKIQIDYWPKVVQEISCEDEENIFAGGASDFVEPFFELKNYDESNVSTAFTFLVYDAEAYKKSATRIPLDVNTSGWTFSDMAQFFSDSSNVGKIVTAEFVTTPNFEGTAEEKDELAGKGLVAFNCKPEVLAKSAHIVNNHGRFEARLFAENEDDIRDVVETAGGKVSYQWQVSNDAENYTDIAGATGKSFSVTKDLFNSYVDKTLRVKITQTFGGTVQESIYSSSYPVYHNVKKSSLWYDGLLEAGSQFEIAKIRGTLVDEFGTSYDAGDFIWDKINDIEESGGYTARVSGYFRASGKKENFYDATADIFVNVQAVVTQEDLPELSTATSSLAVGTVDFTSIDTNLEISFNNGATYTDIPETAFQAKSGDRMLVRARSVGTPLTKGYVRESEPLAVTVEDANLGTQTTEGSGMIEGLTVRTLTLKKKTSKGLTTITPIFNYSGGDCKYEFTWLIDGAPASLYSGVSSGANNAIVLTNSEFGKDAYQIFCMVRLYVPEDDEYDTELGIVSSQITVVIK